MKAVRWDLGCRRGEPPSQGCVCSRPAGSSLELVLKHLLFLSLKVVAGGGGRV